MNFGMGLAGFVDGLNAGMAARDRFDARRERRENKQALAAIDTETKAAYQDAKASGEETGSFEDFWVKYALPKRRVELMRQGDYDTAKKLQDWSETEGAKEGSRLFGSALTKAQMGDASGALDDGIAAAKVKGYLDSGYELKSRDEIKDPDGKLLGYRLTVTDGEGNEFQQDVRPEDVGHVIASFVNPEAAFASSLDRQAAAEKAKTEESQRQTKRGEDMADYETKKAIDKAYEGDSADKDARELEQHRAKKQIDKDMSAPTPAERYQKAFQLRMESDLEFPDKSPAEQKAIIDADLNAMDSYAPGMGTPQATPAAPSGQQSMAPAPQAPPVAQPQGSAPSSQSRVIVDSATGQPVEMPGMGQQQAPATPEPVNQRKATIDSAIADIGMGADPTQVRKKLMQAGISDEEYQAAKKAQAQRL